MSFNAPLNEYYSMEYDANALVRDGCDVTGNTLN